MKLNLARKIVLILYAAAILFICLMYNNTNRSPRELATVIINLVVATIVAGVVFMIANVKDK